MCAGSEPLPDAMHAGYECSTRKGQHAACMASCADPQVAAVLWCRDKHVGGQPVQHCAATVLVWPPCTRASLHCSNSRDQTTAGMAALCTRSAQDCRNSRLRMGKVILWQRQQPLC
jgi:hypothetical protein